MQTQRTYDIICFGDEVPGVLAAIVAAREFRRQTSRYPSVLLMSKGALNQGIGGHLVRGGLAYLDRSQIPLNLRRQLNLATFGDPPAIYREFLREANVLNIALDPGQADSALQGMRRQAGVDLLTGVVIDQVLKEGNKISGIRLQREETYLAKQFIDATVHAELAQAAGATKLSGFGTFGLPDSELSVSLIFQTRGLSPSRLKQIENIYLQRFTNLGDTEAQSWLNIAAGGDQARMAALRQDMVDSSGRLKGMFEGGDYIDMRAPALPVAYHAFRGTTYNLAESGSLLDKANIAKFPGDRLVWNAFLFDVNATEAEALAQNSSRPTPEMVAEMEFVDRWYRNLGAESVFVFPELYIRHAGNITGAVAPLRGTQMLQGGVPSAEGLGTFGYLFDIRGGIRGLGDRAAANGLTQLNFTQPIFNVGIGHALLNDIPNLAVVSPASGFEGYGASAGRIVEHNVGVAQGIGIAAVIALLSDRNLNEMTNQEINQILRDTNRLPKIFGIRNAPDVRELETFENTLVVGRVVV